MPRFSTIFGLGNDQSELDFVDIDTSKDTPVYICPYAIQIRSDDWSQNCGDLIRSFFNEVLDALRNNNTEYATHLLSHLHEPNETCLGVSEGEPSGRGVGTHKSGQLAGALVNSRAFATGLLSDISEAELFLRNVGPDTISDLTTNVLRGLLAAQLTPQGRCAKVWKRDDPRFHDCVKRQEEIDRREGGDNLKRLDDEAKRLELTIKRIKRMQDALKIREGVKAAVRGWLARVGIDHEDPLAKSRYEKAVKERRAYALILDNCQRTAAASVEGFNTCLAKGEAYYSKDGRRLEDPID